MNSVLVTGGCGFVGSNLIESLRRKTPDLEIRVIDSEVMASRTELDGLDVAFTHGDIRDRDAVRSAMRGVTAVVHLAGDTRVMDSIANPQLNFDVNVVGSYNILACARELGVERVIAASTGGAIMGKTQPPYDEHGVPRPISPYGASKLAMEGYISAFAGAYGMACLALRFSNVFGPRSYHKGSVVATFFRKIMAGDTLTVYGDGSQIRDYVYVGDIVHAIELAMERRPGLEALQLGSGRPTTLNDLIRAMREVVGEGHPFEVAYEDFRTGEVRDTTCFVAEAERHLGYRPQVELKEGLARTWQWFQRTYGGR